MISGSTSASNASNISNKKWLTCTLKKFPPKISWANKMESKKRKWWKMKKKKGSKLMVWKTLRKILKTLSFRTKNRTLKRRLKSLRKLKTIAQARRGRINSLRKRSSKRKEITWTWTNSTRRTSSSLTKRQKTSQLKKNYNSSTPEHSTTTGW